MWREEYREPQSPQYKTLAKRVEDAVSQSLTTYSCIKFVWVENVYDMSAGLTICSSEKCEIKLKKQWEIFGMLWLTAAKSCYKSVL
jgi:hypothetical protein